MGEHLLAGALRFWNETKGDFAEVSGDHVADGVAAIPQEELKRIAAQLRHVVTKLGASAAVAEPPDLEGQLGPIAAEVLRAFMAAVGALLSMRRYAAATFLEELRETGADLAAAVDAMGQAIGTPTMAVSAGKVLDRIKHLERCSTHNNAAIRKRLLKALIQLRDAHKEMEGVLKADGEAVGSGADTDSDCDGDLTALDEHLEPEEKELVVRVVAAVTELEEAVKQASQACARPPASPTASGAAAAVAEGPSIGELETAVVQATAAANAVDGLAVHAIGGFDPEAFGVSLGQLRTAAAGLGPVASAETMGELTRAIDAVEAAMTAAVAA